MTDLTNSQAILKATKAQRQAADPSQTRFAAANAGSGKTRVLVERVSRILLQGEDPSKILCLTYTKAAASEMQNRLFLTLGDWSVMNDEDLTEALTKLLGSAPHLATPPIELNSARALFAKALDVPGGLKVQTIHAFCEHILSRFPIEAGILPGFDPVDETDISDIVAQIRQQILEDALADPEGGIAKSLAAITAERADKTLDEIFKWMSQSLPKIEAWEAAGGCETLAAHLGIEKDDTEEIITQKFWDSLDVSELKLYAELLKNGPSKADKNATTYLLDASQIDDPTARYFNVSRIWLTKDRKPRATVFTKKTEDRAATWLEDMRDIIWQVEGQLAGVKILNMTRAIYTLALRFRDLFAARKRAERVLDYSDQIEFVRRLLENKNVSDWVRYKLDGGVAHILVDEAQDTSPAQWKIINILAEPFFENIQEGDPRQSRTLFAVGDEKQSIFGFQGARPEQFLSEIQSRSHYGISSIPMRMSFRSCQQVLDVVDVFLNEAGGLQSMFNVDEYPAASIKMSHIAARTDIGQVEIWPVVPPAIAVKDKAPWDMVPVDAVDAGSPVARLSLEIAKKIKKWLDEGEPIYDRDLKRVRPIRPEDILILVRRRGDLFHAIIRQLKRHEIPIGGADRLKLSEAVIVKDLLALSRFCLLPSDDLSLAEVLKGPIFGYDEAALFDIAVDRDDTLWTALQTRQPDTANILLKILRLSKIGTPFEFYARLLDMRFLDMKGANGPSIRERFYKRLSLEARDALEAFLDQALAHQSKHAPSLQRFIHAFERSDIEIKREPEGAVSEVRVMTVHGAKGLEAPLVILPDTTSVPTDKDVLIPVEGGYMWRQTAAEGLVPYLDAAKTAAQARIKQEQLRLLYVAMTRAETRLVICGPHAGKSKNKLPEDCWYEWASRAMDNLETQNFPTAFDREVGEVLLTGRRYGSVSLGVETAPPPTSTVLVPVPDWVFRPAPREGFAQRATPSHLLADPVVTPVTRSPRSARGLGFMRGNLIHKLLETLPDFAPERRRDMAETILASYPQLSSSERQDVIDEVFGVLDHPDFADLFGVGSRAEVSLAGSAKGLPDGLYLNAQIDRLCVGASQVSIVDYKSNRTPPERPEDVSDLYLGQMAAYRELAREIYPDRAVRCALLWTDAPRLMWLPPDLLDDALLKVASLPISKLS